MVFDRERVQMCIGKQFQHIIQNKRSNDIRPGGGLKTTISRISPTQETSLKTANKTTRQSGNRRLAISGYIRENAGDYTFQ